MIKHILSFFAFIFLLSFTSLAFARSGCCSHHGGVVGCGCGDGTSLSATCAPYYPECNGSAKKTVAAPVKKCQANASLIAGSCQCKSGYALSGSTCIKIPAHAFAANNGRDAWLCNDGYIAKGNSCVLKPLPKTTVKKKK